MLSIKPDRKPDPSTGKMLDDYWGPSVKLLGDMKFLDRLRLYDKDSIPPAVMQKIRQKLVTAPLSDVQTSLILRCSGPQKNQVGVSDTPKKLTGDIKPTSQ